MVNKLMAWMDLGAGYVSLFLEDLKIEASVDNIFTEYTVTLYENSYYYENNELMIVAYTAGIPTGKIHDKEPTRNDIPFRIMKIKDDPFIKIRLFYGVLEMDQELIFKSKSKELNLDNNNIVENEYYPKNIISIDRLYIEDYEINNKKIILKLKTPIYEYFRMKEIEPQTFRDTTILDIFKTLFSDGEFLKTDTLVMTWDSPIKELNIATKMTGISFLKLLKQLYGDVIYIFETDDIFYKRSLRIGWKHFTDNLGVKFWPANRLFNNNVTFYREHEFQYPYNGLKANLILKFSQKKVIDKVLKVVITSAVADKKPTEKSIIYQYPQNLPTTTSPDELIEINYPWEMSKEDIARVAEMTYYKNLDTQNDIQFETFTYTSVEINDHINIIKEDGSILKGLIKSITISFNKNGYRKLIKIDEKQ